MTISLDLVRSHLKADLEDVESDLVTQYLASALTMCQSYCNRKFYDDETARDNDFAQAMLDKTALDTNRNLLLGVDTDTPADCDTSQMIFNRYYQNIGAVKNRVNGIVIDDLIVAAILMTVGYLYVNRDAAEPPAAAKRILEPYQWIGDLVWA